jgi:hypothetical protein
MYLADQIIRIDSRDIVHAAVPGRVTPAAKVSRIIGATQSQMCLLLAVDTTKLTSKPDNGICRWYRKRNHHEYRATVALVGDQFILTISETLLDSC